MALDIEIKERGKAVFLIMPKGRLDTDTYVTFEERVKPLLVQTTKVLIFDMSKLDYISSAGLGVLFFAKKFVEQNKGNFVMTNLQPQIRKVFEIVKALPNESIFESMEEVDKYLDTIQKREIEKQSDPQEE